MDQKHNAHSKNLKIIYTLFAQQIWNKRKDHNNM